MKYLLPKELGGGEVTLFQRSNRGDGKWLTVVVDGGGPQFEIHENWLTPVAPPLPEEPTEPGLYAINGERGAQKLDIVSTDCWFVTGHTRTFTFAEVCEMFGGPDVTIRPLRPAPEPVALPWRDECATGVGIALEIQQRDSDDHVPVIIRGHGCVYLDGEAARQAAAALWTAAGEQS